MSTERNEFLLSLFKQGRTIPGLTFMGQDPSRVSVFVFHDCLGLRVEKTGEQCEFWLLPKMNARMTNVAT